MRGECQGIPSTEIGSAIRRSAGASLAINIPPLTHEFFAAVSAATESKPLRLLLTDVQRTLLNLE